MSIEILELAWNQELARPHYVVNGRYYYDATTLERNRWAVGRDFSSDRNPITTDLSPTSHPVYVKLDRGFVLFVSRPDQQISPLIRSENWSDPPIVMHAVAMRFPDLRAIVPGLDRLPEATLPEFNPEILDELQRLADEEGSLYDLSLPPPPDNRLRETIEALISRLYGLPLSEPPAELTSFEEASRLLQWGQIVNFTIDPLLQVWAGPPGTPNRIVTLIGRDGLSYLVLARYDPATNQIYHR